MVYKVNYKLLMKNVVGVIIISGFIVLSLLFIVALPKIVNDVVNYLSILY